MRLYNSLSGQKEEFITITPGEVKMYSCGPTVYDYFHIGNARPFIVFDALRRYLEYKGYKVTFVQNFTDIDDKMIRNANERGVSVKELADANICEYFRDARGLGIKEATFHPKATDHMEEIIKTVKKLTDNGYAYNVDGNVYFSTDKFADYGKLSHQPIEDLEAGARIEVNEDKHSPMDFVLWKKKKEGEPFWESPWGQGRPGWHIECSAMANKYLGATIDIHAGGKDLIFPHHENEIAQSEAASGSPFANFWLHNGYINIDNRKMSKSEGNFFTVRDIAEKFDYSVIRFFLLSSHYRSPINFSEELMTQTQTALQRIYTAVENLEFLLNTAEDIPAAADFLPYKEKFIEALDDDFNTADAIGHLFSLVKELNTHFADGKASSKQELLAAKSLMSEMLEILGLSIKTANDDLTAEVEDLIMQRQQARKDKNFALADEIRDRLLKMDIILEDTRQGVKWKKV